MLLAINADSFKHLTLDIWPMVQEDLKKWNMITNSVHATCSECVPAVKRLIQIILFLHKNNEWFTCCGLNTHNVLQAQTDLNCVWSNASIGIPAEAHGQEVLDFCWRHWKREQILIWWSNLDFSAMKRLLTNCKIFCYSYIMSLCALNQTWPAVEPADPHDDWTVVTASRPLHSNDISHLSHRLTVQKRADDAFCLQREKKNTHNH